MIETTRKKSITRRFGLPVVPKRSLVTRDCFRDLVSGSIRSDSYYHVYQTEMRMQKKDR